MAIYDRDVLSQIISKEPEQWRPLVFTNGCFDLLHAGHVRYLQAAKSLGKTLVLGLNSDQSVRTIKGHQPPGYPLRPLVPQEQRAEVMAALAVVDGVIIFDEPTAIVTIGQLQPDIYVKGGDYTIETLPESPIVHSYGGQLN